MHIYLKIISIHTAGITTVFSTHDSNNDYWGIFHNHNQHHNSPIFSWSGWFYQKRYDVFPEVINNRQLCWLQIIKNNNKPICTGSFGLYGNWLVVEDRFSDKMLSVNWNFDFNNSHNCWYRSATCFKPYWSLYTEPNSGILRI